MNAEGDTDHDQNGSIADPTPSADATASASPTDPVPSDGTALPTDPDPSADPTPAADEQRETGGRTRGFSRRRLVGAAGLAGVMGLAGFGLGRGTAPDAGDAAPSTTDLTYPFRGEHQAGILTPAQDNMYTAAFDVSTDDFDELKQLLADWAVACEQMCAGELIGGGESANREMPPADTGEAWNYPPGGLTITFGVGRSLFVDDAGNDRFGLKAKMPQVLADGVPRFANETLKAGASDGDLLIQACSNDAQVCVHAIRNLTRMAFGTATLKWGQIGYGRTSSTSTSQETPRNLFGFKDGTNNLKAESDDDLLNEQLWVQDGDDDAAGWMTGGTYFVARKIHMFLEVWDRVRLSEQEQVFGRDKRYGAPLSVGDSPTATQEFTAVDYAAKAEDGKPEVPADSHIAVVSPEQNDDHHMLRRGYNYTDGNDSLGRLDAGLFFIAYVRDPRTNFYPILSKMTEKDALTEYLQHQASALFAIPPGLAQGDTMFATGLFA